jgi:hypothetical protein
LWRNDLDVEVRHYQRRRIDTALLNDRHLAQAPLLAGVTTRTTERACSLFRISVIRTASVTTSPLDMPPNDLTTTR